jgi:Ca2+-binding RTX toxin-like protein
LRQSTDTLSDAFSYTMRDAAGATSTTSLTVTIHGADDAPTISNLAVGATSISFVASDPDNATLSLASPFASAFGNPSITGGATTSLTPTVRTTAVSGTLQVTDGSYTADAVGLYLGTSGNNTATAPNPTGPNAMYGFGGSDILTGGAGADSIVGGAGADTLSGGAGNDTFYLANGDFAAGELIDGGADADAIVLTNPTTVNFTNGTVSNIETLTGSTGNDTVTMSAAQWAGLNAINLGGGTNILNVVASGDISAAATPTVGNVTTGNLTGTSGNDSITLTGSQLDAIIAGAGSISLGAGTDTINLTSTSADLNMLGATNASIQGVEAISAATAASGVTIMLSGQTEGFTITGSAYNDTITGGSGTDRMIGGTGNDTYVVASTGDIVTENAGEGIDTIQSSVTYTLPANVENLILTGTGNISGTGNALDNAITGNDGNNTLAGLGGADALDGGLGTDTATYAASATGVNVSLATGLGHGGDAEGDTLVNIENLTGSGFNDTLEGNGGNNVLTGGAGADTLIGGAGNDTLIGGAGADVLTGGADADTFVFNAIGDSSPTGADTITDFVHGTDVIDLSAIDANTSSSGNQTFAYFAQSVSAFANGVSWFESNGNTIVQADVNGNTSADLRIVLTGTNLGLSASDFRL